MAYDTEKQFQFYDDKNNFPPNQITLVYKKMFNKKAPSYGEIREFRRFKAISKSNIIELTPDKTQYILQK